MLEISIIPSKKTGIQVDFDVIRSNRFVKMTSWSVKLLPALASMGGSIRQYFRVLYALLRREEERRRSAPMEAVLDLMEPVFMIAIMSFAFWFLGRRNSTLLGGVPVLFYATGFFALYFFIYVSNRMRRSVPLAYKRFPIERRLDHIIVHLLLKVFDYTILGLLLFGVLYVLFTTQALPYNFTAIMQACAALVMLGFGWGVFGMVMARAWWVWPYLQPLINRLLIIFTGVIFLADFLPPGTRHVVSYIPLVHAIGLFRTGFYPNYPTLVLDVHYLFECAVIAVALGLVLERVFRRGEL